jgi:hypothetical protein
MKVQIEQKELKRLLRAEAMLNALEAGGVDNWEGYDFSLEEYRNTIQREEDIEELLQEVCNILADAAYEPSERGAGIAFRDESYNLALSTLNSRIESLKP